MVRSSAFHVAFRVLLIGVGLSVLAVAALPLLKLPSETRVAIVDRASLPIVRSAAPAPAPSPRPPERPDDHRRVAAAGAIPGLYSDSSATSGPIEARPANRVTVDQAVEFHSRPVPPPQMAEAPFPERSLTAPPRPDSIGQISRTLVEEPEVRERSPESPRVFPGSRGDVDANAVTPPAPRGPDLAEMRREIDRLAESHLQDQRTEIQKAQLVLSEMQNARQIDLLRDEIRTLRDEQAQIRSAAAARPAPPPEQAPEAPPTASASVTALTVPPVPPAVQIERGTDPARYTIRLRGASLGAAVNELAALAGWNVVTGDEFSQTVTATLTDVTAEEAVEALLEAHGWVIRREGRRLLIDRAPIREFSPSPASSVVDPPAPETPVSEASGSETALVVESVPSPENLRTQVFQLRHAPAAEILPHVERLLTPGVGLASPGESPADQAGTTRTDRLVVRDRAENLDQLALAIAGLDHPPHQVEIEMTILQVKLPGIVRFRSALAGFLQSQRRPDQPCPRCGRLHPTAAPAGPACTLPEPEWTLGGSGWEFAQLQGTHEEFVDAVKRIAPVDVLAHDRIRVLHQQSAEVGLLDLVRQTGATVPIPQGEVRFLNAGSRVSIRPHLLEAGETRISITSTGDAPAGETVTEPSGTDVVVQKGCSLVVAGLQAAKDGRSNGPAHRGVTRSELLILLTPRSTEAASATVTE